MLGLHNNHLIEYNSSSEFQKNKKNVIPLLNPANHLPLIVTDPIGDGGIADIKEIRGRIFNENLEIEYGFADGVPLDSIIAFLFLDIDRDPMTGFFDPAFFNDIGVDYYIVYDPLFSGNEIFIYDTLGLVGTQTFQLNANSISFSVPLSLLGNDDGEMDLVALAGNMF